MHEGLSTLTPEVLTYPMVDRDPLSRWRHGSVTLLGDAAHPTYPIGSNGASQAILDARSLAWHLATSESPRAGLDAYEETRRPPTTDVVLANSALGPEKVVALVEQRAPDGFTHIENVLTAEELGDITGHYRRDAGFDIAELNDRPSRTVPRRGRPTNTEETQ